MAYSNAYTYPLPYPTELQVSQISSYSSLANALGTDPGYTSQQRCVAKCDAATKSQTIYFNAPPVNNPSYPYPARNVINPGTYPGRTPLSISNGRRLGDETVIQDEPSEPTSQYDRLPQPIITETDVPYGYRAGIEPPTIRFRRKGGQGPYSVWELLTMNTMPDLVDGDSPVLVQSIERRIKVKLIWPGYSRYPFEKRIPIKQGAPLTPTLLLVTLAQHISEFARWIQNEDAIVEPGQERWTITEVSRGASARWKGCVITSLQHRMGSTWQPEIFYPRG